MIRSTHGNLKKLEEIFDEAEYTLRYELGNFHAGYCVLEDKKVVVVNRYFSLESKINTLVDILLELDLDQSLLTYPTKQMLYNIYVVKK